MLTYLFAHDDVLRTRFAISPLHELMQSVGALRDPASASIHVPWVRAVQPRVADLDLGVLEALLPAPGRYQPDFVAPPPQTPVPDVRAEIERVRDTPPAQVREELRVAYEDEPVPRVLRPLLDRPREAIAAVADLIATYWDRALAPFWPAVRETLEDDIAKRSRAMVTDGPIEVFADLHPEVRWCDDHLEVRRPYDATFALAGRGLLLIPSAFVWPRCAALWDGPWQPAVIYPARGVGDLWAPARRDPGSLRALMGDRRATILARLDRETTTTALAGGLGLSASSVSEHLAVLRDAGLVRARRDGREVLYVRTPAGDVLLRAALRRRRRPRRPRA